MKRWTWNVAVTALSVVTISILAIPASPTSADGFPRILRPRTPIEKLAHKIDELQEDIDRFGTIAVKQPDVWGEARLTKHRDEYEKTLYSELGNFKETLQATLRRSDQAFLLQTLAIQAALGGKRPALLTPSGSADAPATTIAGQTPPDGMTTPTQPATVPTLPTLVNPPNLSNAEVVSSSNGATTEPGIAVEPQIKLDQLSRYINHLHSLRRINEGDDTADAPGYSMNLMRFPVSVLPGTKTREGYGAEVTFTVIPCVSEKRLASTLESLVINDLLDALTFPILRVVESKPNEKACKVLLLKAKIEHLTQRYTDLTALLTALNENKEYISAQLKNAGKNISDEEKKLLVQELASVTSRSADSGFEVLFDVKSVAQLKRQNRIGQVVSKLPGGNREQFVKLADQSEAIELAEGKLEDDRKNALSQLQQVDSQLKSIEKELRNIEAATQVATVSTQSRWSQYPVSSTQLVSIFGEEELVAVAKAAETHLDQKDGHRVHYNDVRAFLGEELDKAWKMLARLEQTGSYRAWDTECVGLADAVRTEGDIAQRRAQFRHNLKGHSTLTGTMEALAWAILVDSAILDQQLHEDMKRLAAEPGRFHIDSSKGVPHFWGTVSGSDATSRFRDYLVASASSRLRLRAIELGEICEDLWLQGGCHDQEVCRSSHG